VLTVYRIAQEALTNVTRHAHAEHAWVELTRSDGRVRLRVSDDGVGPSPAPDRGAGLLGIEERVVAVGGSWDLSSRPGGGTILDVSIPVDPR
jgi:signal transduction histidine kinase